VIFEVLRVVNVQNSVVWDMMPSGLVEIYQCFMTMCCVHLVVLMKVYRFIRGGADKFLARPISRCRRTESIVSLERGVFSCAELQVFSCYRG